MVHDPPGFVERYLPVLVRDTVAHPELHSTERQAAWVLAG
jgi:hypothetical protein